MTYMQKMLQGAAVAFGFVVVLFAAMVVFGWESGYTKPDEATARSILKSTEVVEDEVLTAKKLREHCNSEIAWQGSFCNGYMLGFVEGHGSSYLVDFCGTEDIRNADQTIQSFKNYMEAHPEDWNRQRDIVLALALLESFSCEDEQL